MLSDLILAMVCDLLLIEYLIFIIILVTNKH